MKKLFLAAVAAASALCANAQINSAADDGYCRRAELMYNDKNYVGCIDQMMHLKSQSPTPAELEEADFYIAMSSAHLGKTDAQSLLKYFLWRHPGSKFCTLARIAIADILLDEKEYGEALIQYNLTNPATLDSATAARLNFNRAFCMLKRGEYDSALPLYEELSRTKDYSNSARFYIGYIAYIRKDYRQAAETLSKVNTSEAPGNMADYYLAQIYYIEGNYSKAASKAQAILNRGVDAEFHAEALRVAGESLYHLDNDTQAIKYLRQYVAEVSNPLPSALYILGVADYRQGDYQTAIERLTPVASLDNAMGQSANLFIGQSLMQRANYSSAMIAFEKALKMDFDPSVQETAFYNYAVANTQGGHIPFGSTVTTFEEFLRRYPNSRYTPKIREYIVAGYMTDNNYPAALASIEAVRNPSEAILKAKQQVLYTLGTRELTAGNISSAINHLSQAQKLANHNPQLGAEAGLWLGEALYADGKYDEAARCLTNYLNNRHAARENRPLAIYDLAYARFGAGKYSDALADFSRFVSEPGQSSSATIADAYNRMADCYYYESEYDRAADAYNKAYTVNPSAGDYALYQGALMKGIQRRYNEKIEGMRVMIQRFPSSSLVPSALLEIGESYDQLNQHEKAIESYSMVAARYPSTQQGRQASLLLALAYLNNGNNAQAVSTYKNLISSAPSSLEARQAMDNLKLLMADEGRLSEYAAFIDNIPGAAPIEPSEMERLSFASAEREYLNSGMTGRLMEYLDRYPEGASRPTALAYAVKANVASGNNQAVIKYSTELITSYPDNEAVPEALKAKADTEFAQGKFESALASYSRLSESAATPYMINESRIGMARAASELGRHDTVIECADALISSSTISHECRAEAGYLRASALAARGETDAAIAAWTELAKDLSNLHGTMSAFAIAETYYNQGNLKKARKNVENLINSDQPYDYWYARAIILLSDINRSEGNTYEADVYLTNLKEKYPGSEIDIFNMIDQRLPK